MAEYSPQSGPASNPADPPSWPLSRIILLAVLAVAVGLLVFDKVGGQLAQRRAYKKLARETNLGQADQEDSDNAEQAKGPVKFVSINEVHGWLGQPAETEDKPAARGISSELVETYRYPGVFNRYMVRVKYNVRHKTEQDGGGVDEENSTVKAFTLVTKGPFASGEEEPDAPAAPAPVPPANAPAAKPATPRVPAPAPTPKPGNTPKPSESKSAT